MKRFIDDLKILADEILKRFAIYICIDVDL